MPGFFVHKPLLTLYISTDKLSMLRAPLVQTQSVLQSKLLDLLLLCHVSPQGQAQCVTCHRFPSAWEWMGLMLVETWVHLLCVVFYLSKVWLFILLREQTEHVVFHFCLVLENNPTFCIVPSDISSSTSFSSSMTIALAFKWWFYCPKMSCWLLGPKKTE